MKQEEQRARRTLWWALGMGALAIGIYVGFLLMNFKG